MERRLVFDAPVVLVGDADFDKRHLRPLSDFAFIAVDGGANTLTDFDVAFEYLMGDFDSARPEILHKFPLSHKIVLPDQNFGDFEKALQVIGAPKIYGLGFLGGRLDHSLQALSLLAKFPDRDIELISDDERAVIVRSGTPLAIGASRRVSFVSFGECVVEASEGLEFPLDGLKLSARAISLSNRSLQNYVKVEYSGDAMIAIFANE